LVHCIHLTLLVHCIHLTFPSRRSEQSYINGKAIPMQAYLRPWEFQAMETLRFWDSRHIKEVSLLALRTGRLYHPGNYSWYSSLLKAETTPGP
jgi:hypothetical protein